MPQMGNKYEQSCTGQGQDINRNLLGDVEQDSR